MKPFIQRIPNHLHPTYNWVNAANEIQTLAMMDESDALTYCRETSSNAADHGYLDVTEDYTYELWLICRTGLWTFTGRCEPNE